MKYISAILLLFTFLHANCDRRKNNEKSKTNFTPHEATVCIDAFNKAFYNTSTKVYNISTEKKQRAAIWTQAIYWDMIMNAYSRTKDQKYFKLIHEIYEGACGQYDNFNWNNTTEWFIYDDIMWWVISLCRAYEITGEDKYLELAVSGFDRVWYGSEGIDERGSYDKEKGGMRWGWKRDEWKGKMSCINYPTVVGSALLYQLTGKEDYLNKAKEIYDWSGDNLFNKSTGAVADSKHGDGEPHWKMHLYNQGSCIGAGVALYQITHESKYLADAVLAADYVKNEMCDAKGMFPFENGIEQGVYAAIFAQYIVELIDCDQPQYHKWLLKNINNSWKNRDQMRKLTFKDFAIPCPEGDIEVYDASGCPALMQLVPPKLK
ncbi:glycoside hydrolase family 76 protein [Plebeiibacterium marinum]|uniref:Glycoside hydrolase family 76 protein n=1 Tax=Plebeiibacterium marinum TaxID=2992111 RepID=A0AAE3SIJ5_9BACT|nr:glycoside hydrolase family 76 protein [Plebeiobacterium marinum]MCW3804459.1 glycoside hydrolase family 76 protein [Plebeiobacterium marinum]